MGSLRHLPRDSVGIILKGFSVEELCGLLGTNRLIHNAAKGELRRRREEDLQALTNTLSALHLRDDEGRFLWPQWDSKREILHYLDGFVGPIQWMFASSFILYLSPTQSHSNAARGVSY